MKKTPNKYIAVVLAILLGGLGIHQIYLRRLGLGLTWFIFVVLSQVAIVTSTDHNLQVAFQFAHMVAWWAAWLQAFLFLMTSKTKWEARFSRD